MSNSISDGQDEEALEVTADVTWEAEIARLDNKIDHLDQKVDTLITEVRAAAMSAQAAATFAQSVALSNASVIKSGQIGLMRRVTLPVGLVAAIAAIIETVIRHL